MAATRVPLSVWCDAARVLGVPEGHGSCAGNWVHILPTAPEWGPLLTYRCGCPCHEEESTT